MDWIQSIDSSWTLFLDRDGVINKRILNGYVTSIDEFDFEDGVLEAIPLLTKYFYKIFVVTNQQGVGKKIMSERNLLDIHRYMTEKIKEVNGSIAEVFAALELKSDPLNTRKPKPDMAFIAKDKHPEIDFLKSVMVGDTDSDIQFGINLGMKTVRIKGHDAITFEADLTCNSLKEFADLCGN
jgi:D-glycero-D-manno-heptose 1,7-bisphosphate phosphatase